MNIADLDIWLDLLDTSISEASAADIDTIARMEGMIIDRIIDLPGGTSLKLKALHKRMSQYPLTNEETREKRLVLSIMRDQGVDPGTQATSQPIENTH